MPVATAPTGVPPLNIQVSVDLKQLKIGLEKETLQLRYAASVAINDSLKTAQAKVREHIDQTYTIRRKSYHKNSVKITSFAKKDTLAGELAISPPGGGNDVLSQHEDGGKKVVREGKNLAIPSSFIQPSRGVVIPRRKRPSALGTKAFKIRTRAGDELLLTKTGRGKNARNEIAYFLTPDATLKPTLKFNSTVRDAVNLSFNDHFTKAFAKAKRTAK